MYFGAQLSSGRADHQHDDAMADQARASSGPEVLTGFTWSLVGPVVVETAWGSRMETARHQFFLGLRDR